MPRHKQQWSADIKRWEHKGYLPRIKDNKQSGFTGNDAAIKLWLFETGTRSRQRRHSAVGSIRGLLYSV